MTSDDLAWLRRVIRSLDKNHAASWMLVSTSYVYFCSAKPPVTIVKILLLTWPVRSSMTFR